MDLPDAVLDIVLALRKENGLEPTKAALESDLERSGAKWVLEETPRYRKAGRSPLYFSGKFLTAKGVDPATGEADGKTSKKQAPAKREAKAAKTESTPEPTSPVNEMAFYKVLHGKGFAVKMTQDLLTGKLETKVPTAIEKLGLQFGPIPSNAEGIFVSQTTPQIQVSLPLDKFLELAGIKP